MQNNPPMYSLDAIKYGRSKLVDNQQLLIVEGYTDAIVYSRLNEGNRTILPIKKITGDGGKESIIAVSNQLPKQFFIVDDDLESMIDEKYRETLGSNVFTTWSNNDVECWCYLALENTSNLDLLDLSASDITMALKLSRKMGILRIIMKKKVSDDINTRWKLNFRKFKEEILQNSQVYPEDGIIKKIIDSQRKDTVSYKRWGEKLDKTEKKYSNTMSIRLSTGHDLTFFLYYFREMRKNKLVNEDNYKIFEKNLRNNSLRHKEGWKSFLSSEIGDLLK